MAESTACSNIASSVVRIVALALVFGLAVPFSQAGPSSVAAFVTRPALRVHTLGARKWECSGIMAKSASDDGSTNDDDGIENSSPMGKAILVIGKSTSSIVSLAFFVALAYRRDALMLSFFIGAIGNGILSKVLKKLLNQDRPDELDESDHIKLKPSDKGMPSSHAMSLGFICTFTALGLPQSALPLALYVVCSLYYRVNSKLHTLEQILVGLAFGVANGFLWRDLTYGTSPIFTSVHVMDHVSAYLLPKSGVFPPVYLLIPATIGAAVVGSFEHRISHWLSQRSTDQSQAVTEKDA